MAAASTSLFIRRGTGRVRIGITTLRFSPVVARRSSLICSGALSCGAISVANLRDNIRCFCSVHAVYSDNRVDS